MAATKLGQYRLIFYSYSKRSGGLSVCYRSVWNMAAEKSESANDTTVKPFPYQVAGHLVPGELITAIDLFIE